MKLVFMKKSQGVIMTTKINTQDNNNKPLNYSAADFMPKSKIDKKILSERAALLAKQELKKAEGYDKLIGYVRFQLGANEYYGIPYRYIKEVIVNYKPTYLPNTKEYIAGIINRRGALLTLLDLKKFFYLSNDKSPANGIIVVEHKKISMGILVDNIHGSDFYQSDTLQPSIAAEKNGIKSEYILGIHKGMTAIINIEYILTDIKQQLK